MNYEWDERKNTANIERRGFGFEVIGDFEWDYASGPEFDYRDGEEREVWIGPAGSQVYVLVITMRGDVTRIISMRIADSHEKRRWKKEFQNA